MVRSAIGAASLSGYPNAPVEIEGNEMLHSLFSLQPPNSGDKHSPAVRVRLRHRLATLDQQRELRGAPSNRHPW